MISLAGNVLSHQLHCSFWMVSLCLFEVEALLDHELVTFSRGKGRNQMPKAFYRFLIKWANYTEDNNKWEPEEGLLTCDDMIKEYKAKNGLAEKAIDIMVNA